MGRLTTHVLDTASGRPAAGLRIDLYRRDGDSRTQVLSVVTNDDGRVDAPLMEGGDMAAAYESWPCRRLSAHRRDGASGGAVP